MPKNFKQRLADGETCLGAWLTVPSAEVAEAMASLGFDWLVVDMEHGAGDVHNAALAFIAAERHGCTPMARLPSADPFLGRRLLDAGACGLFVPVVESAEAFAEFAQHCLYPPLGRRGVALGRFNRWGDDFEPYFRTFDPLLVPLVETRAGVTAADSIAALPVVDALFLGPYDLSADLGVPGNFNDPGFCSAVETVKAACARHGKAAGFHQVNPDPEDLRQKVADGFRLIAYGTDIVAMRWALGRPRDLLAD